MSGKVMITGASGGMGRVLCEVLAREGWTVLGLDHNPNRLASLAARIGSGRFHALDLDLRDERLVDQVEKGVGAVGGLDALVNLAGVSQGAPLESLSDEDWEASLAVNVTAPMKLSRVLLPFLKRSGSGSIVNVASPVALRGAKKPSYAASKAALLGLTMSLARDLGKFGIRVNALLPGPTLTEMTRDWDDEKQRQVAQSTFLGRLCQPEEFAKVVRFLISRDASYVTGSVLDVTGGGLWGP